MIKQRKKITLKRELGLFEATSCGVGIILGAGIYALIGVATSMGGNAVWLSFMFAALLAAFTGLSYAELSSIFPKDAGEYIYAQNSFGNSVAFVVGWVIIIGGIIMGATVALGFGGYLTALTGAPILLGAIGLILVLSFINFYGIKQSAWFNILFTLVEAGGLILIIILGLGYLGSVDYFEMPHGITGVFEAAALIFFAFIGFETIVKLSEETRCPREVIPKALLLAIVITTTLYILVAIAAVSILDWQVLGASDAPLADVAAAAMGAGAFTLLGVIALFSTANTVLMELVATSRLMYGMAKTHSLPFFLSVLHSGRKTPWVAVLLVCIFSVVFALPTDIKAAAEVSDFTIFVVFGVVNVSLIVLRYKQPDLKREFRSPLNIGRFPVLAGLGTLTSLFLIFHLDAIIILAGIVLTLSGYFVFRIASIISKRR